MFGGIEILVEKDVAAGSGLLFENFELLGARQVAEFGKAVGAGFGVMDELYALLECAEVFATVAGYHVEPGLNAEFARQFRGFYHL